MQKEVFLVSKLMFLVCVSLFLVVWCRGREWWGKKLGFDVVFMWKNLG